MLEFEEYKVKLNNMKPTLQGLVAALKRQSAQEELAELETKTEAPGW